MRSNPPEAKHDGRSNDSLADNGEMDGVEAIADRKSWRTTKSSLRTCSGDYRKYAHQHIGHQQQARCGDFKGNYRLFNNFFQN